MYTINIDLYIPLYFDEAPPPFERKDPTLRFSFMWIYRVVTATVLCPNVFDTSATGAPFFIATVHIEWRKVCGVTFLSRSVRFTIALISRQSPFRFSLEPQFE